MLKKLSLLSVTLTLTLVGSGCGSKHTTSTNVIVVDPPITSSGGIIPVCSSGGCSSGGVIVPVTSSGGSSGGTIVSSSGGSTGSTGGTVISSGGNYYGSSGTTTTSGSSGSASISGDTKDVDLQRAAVQSQEIEDRAQGLASQFSMNIDAARNLTQISDKMSVLTNQEGGMTDDDRVSLTQAALGVAGISGDQVNQAYAAYIKGDKSAVDNLVGQAAVNLGMPSDAGLRDQILPSLGITLGQ